jgi:hypothetical protein
VDLHPVAHQVPHGLRRRVAVRVVGADGHQRDPRPRGRQEPRVGVGAAVVRHLEHVGADVGPPVEDALLGLRAQVAGEEDPHAALGDPDQQAEVVGRRRRGGDLRRRRQDLDGGGADRAAIAGHEGHPVRAGPAGQRVDAPSAVIGRRERAGAHLVHLPSGERAGEAGHVVGVEVREQHQRHVADAQPPQAPVLGTDVRAGVDQHRLARRRRDDERVALSHVAGHHVGGRGRPAPHDLPERPAHQHHTDHDGQEDRSGGGAAPQQDDDHPEQQGQQDRAHGPGRPGGHAVGDARRPVRDQHQPADRPARDPHQRIGHRRDHGGQHGGREPQDRRHRHRGGGEQVGRQRDQRDLPGQRGDQRGGGHPRGRAHRDGVRQRSRDP